MRHLIFTYCVILFWTSIASGQEAPQLNFLQDSIAIGKPFSLSLTYKHPKDQDVFFPKSPNLFTGFELIQVIPLETNTSHEISTDSVIYTLKSFEVNGVQTLQLPLWQILNGDSLQLMSNVDTVFMKSNIADSLLAKAEFKFRQGLIPNTQKINYSLIFRWFLIVLGSVAFFLLFLRKPIERQYRKWKFNKRHYDFTQQFRKSMKAAENLPNSVELWKKHMEWLDGKPYTTLSSSEITKQSGDERLGEALKEIDASIYGGQNSERLLLALQILYDQALEKFKLKKSTYYKSLN